MKYPGYSGVLCDAVGGRGVGGKVMRRVGETIGLGDVVGSMETEGVGLFVADVGVPVDIVAMVVDGGVIRSTVVVFEVVDGVVIVESVINSMLGEDVVVEVVELLPSVTGGVGVVVRIGGALD